MKKIQMKIKQFIRKNPYLTSGLAALIAVFAIPKCEPDQVKTVEKNPVTINKSVVKPNDTVKAPVAAKTVDTVATPAEKAPVEKKVSLIKSIQNGLNVYKSKQKNVIKDSVQKDFAPIAKDSVVIARIQQVQETIAADTVQSATPAATVAENTVDQVKIDSIAQANLEASNPKIVPQAFIKKLAKEFEENMPVESASFEARTATSAMTRMRIKTSSLKNQQKQVKSYMVANIPDSSMYVFQHLPGVLGKKIVSYYYGTKGHMDAYGQSMYEAAEKSISANPKKSYKTRYTRFNHVYDEVTQAKTDILSSTPVAPGLFINKLFETNTNSAFTINANNELQAIPKFRSIQQEIEFAKSFNNKDVKTPVALKNQN